MAQPTKTTGTVGNVDQDQLKKALQDGLVGRKALMRAYEKVSERVDDTETQTMLRRFADEEKQEYEAAEKITKDHGGDPGTVQNVKEEVAAFLGKSVFGPGEGPYRDARDLMTLYGLEAAGHAGAIFMKNVAERTGDTTWTTEIDKSIERCKDHSDYLRGRIDDLGGTAFTPGTSNP